VPDLSMLEGAAILAAGMLAGRFWPARRRSQKPKDVQPVCGCDHHLSYHDGKTGECHGTNTSSSAYNDRGIWVGFGQVPCTCRRYSGPEPLPSYFAPEIT
jgi:hypothetical protein